MIRILTERVGGVCRKTPQGFSEGRLHPALRLYSDEELREERAGGLRHRNYCLKHQRQNHGKQRGRNRSGRP